MNKLIENLIEFQSSRTNDENLENSFRKLAKYLLYGGHFHCSDRYDLYITSVEFYYHEEIKNNERVVDPIMYHRNVKDKPSVPYFKVGTLYPHWSGVDITFEKENHYRASALIRSYKVIVHNNFEKSVELQENDLSTYVYDYLFDGLSVDKIETKIDWIDDNVNFIDCKVNVYKRKNVHLFKHNSDKTDDDLYTNYDHEFVKIKNKQDPRPWRYVKEGSLFDKEYDFKIMK